MYIHGLSMIVIIVNVVVVVLYQKMPEEEAFAVLVKIMYNYGHRDVFKANFQNLHLMFYQLDRLLEVGRTYINMKSVKYVIYIMHYVH